MPAAPSPVRPRRVGMQILALAGVFAFVAGFVAHRTWVDLPRSRVLDALALALIASGLAWALSRWRGWRRADALAVVWGAAALLMWGPLPVSATLLLAAGAVAAGSWLCTPARPLLAGATGIAMMAGALGWLLPVALHSTWVYLPLLAGLVALRRRALREALLHARAAWREAVDAAPRAAAWGVLAAGLASTGAWLPTMQYDDLAYHLGLPWQLVEHGRYALDPTHQAWALAPWAGDVVHAIAQVVARAEARGPVNLAWLFVLCAGAWRLAGQHGATPAFRWAAMATVATLPTFATLLGGMQTELAAAAVLTLLACLVSERDAPPRGVLVFGVLAGLLAGLKLTHPASALGLAALAAWRWRARLRAHPSGLLAAVGLAAAVGGSSYAYAWAVAGNPVLPLLNDVFRSPAFPAIAFHDARWTTDAPLALPWRLTFATSAHVEGWNGGFGFALPMLAGATLLALVRRRTRWMTAAALVAIALPLAILPYARYAVPGLALLVPPAVAALQVALPRRAALAVLAALVVVDLAYAANSGWMLRTGGVRRSLAALGQDAPLFERYVPERLVYQQLRRRYPGETVLDFTGATHAELAGAGRTAEWYAPRLHAAARTADPDAGGAAWARVIREEGVRHIVFRRSTLAPARAAALERLGADRVVTVADVEWWALPPRMTR